jgi:uncharacterized protein (DUF1015 family)
MAQIAPFQAIRYNPQQVGRDLSKLIAPPYDVLDEADKHRLLAGDAHNIVEIDLPHMPPKDAGPDQLYARSAEMLQRWQREGVLVREPQPAFYLYHQRLQHKGQSYTRRMFFARLRLEPFGERHVFGHEETFGGPKADRLKLTMATRCLLSPVFGLYPDPTGSVLSALEEGLPNEPDVSGTQTGIEHRLWTITDPRLCARAAEAFIDTQVFIADGHHRYGMALMNRDEQIAKRGELPARDPANFVLICLAVMEQPGMLVLPTHRVITDLAKWNVETFLQKAGVEFEATKLGSEPTAGDLEARLADQPRAIALIDAASGEKFLLVPKHPDPLAALEPLRSQAWRELDVAVLHRYLIDELLVKQFNAGRKVTCEYYKSAEAAVARLTENRKGIGFLLRATPLEAMREVCLAGDLMPQKSTYFFPKLATGLVIYPLS